MPFTETVRMIAELRRHGQVEIEQLVFPDEVHGFLLHENWVEAYSRAGDFFDRTIGGGGYGPGPGVGREPGCRSG